MFQPRKRIRLGKISIIRFPSLDNNWDLFTTDSTSSSPIERERHRKGRHHKHKYKQEQPALLFNTPYLLRLVALAIMSLDSFSEIFHALFNRGGGRRPQLPNQQALDADEDTWLHPAAAHEARLTIVQITDVYTLDNFASLKTMMETIRTSQQTASGGSNNNNKVVSMLTGDFLAPYLLSSIDHGKGMMMAINETPIDYLTWGNHGKKDDNAER